MPVTRLTAHLRWLQRGRRSSSGDLSGIHKSIKAACGRLFCV